jgi:hypothetical protein
MENRFSLIPFLFILPNPVLMAIYSVQSTIICTSILIMYLPGFM